MLKNTRPQSNENVVLKQKIQPLTRKRAALEDLSNQSKSQPQSTKSNTSNNSILTNASKKSSASTITLRKNLKRPLQPSSVETTTSVTSQLEQNTEQAKYVEIESRPAPAKKLCTKQPWEELDAEDIDDPLMVAEYSNDIFDYLYELELKYMPNPKYILDQEDLSWGKRALLMDWLVEVHTKLHLLPETLFLAANAIDRFMTVRVVTMDKLQLVGITALLIAAKYEEVFPPVLNHYAILTGKTFDEADILGAEKFMLQVLDFELSYPNPLNFLRRLSKADDYDVETRAFGKYLLEITIIDHAMLQYPPSLLAAAAMYLARRVLDKPGWGVNFVHYSGDYAEHKVRAVARRMAQYLVRPVEYESLYKKYASRKFYKASLTVREWAKTNLDKFLYT